MARDGRESRPEGSAASERASLDPRRAEDELASLRAERRASGLGLRAQIGLASLTTLALAVLLFALATDRLATRAFELERATSADLVAASLAARFDRMDVPSIVLDRVEGELLGPSDVIGFAIVSEDGSAQSRGVTSGGVVGEARLARGVVRLWVRDPGEQTTRSLVGLIVLYALVSALAILGLSYVLLTHLIVRPVERLERAAERLAKGERSSVRIDGAREVASLARTFNALGDDLRDERRQREARLRELERALSEREAALAALERAKASLEATQGSLIRSEKLASVGRLAAGVAHEIGNPLSAILGLVELLREGGLEPKEEGEFLARIQSETSRIHRIIRNLLDYARAPQDRAEPASSASRAEVGRAIDEAVALVTPQKDLRAIRVERRVPDEAIEVAIDADRLTQLLVNLILNAADAIEARRAEEGPRDPREEAGSITIEVAREEPDDRGPSVQISVSDSGVGFDEATRASIFEPFFTTKPVGRGTGLGLAVCQTIVEEAGGTLTAEHAEGGGACMSIRLPE